MSAVAVLSMLIAESRGSRIAWIAKPTASTAFIVAALIYGMPSAPYGRWVVGALCLSWLGDVLLIPRDDKIFRLGILSFLAAHVAYGIAFVVRGVDVQRAVIALAAVAVPGFFLGRYFVGHAPAKLKPAVMAYVGVLSAMLALSFATRGDVRIPIAAFAFYCSDLSVALNRFVRPSAFHRAWGAPLYFAAQLVFAATVSLPRT